MQDLDCPTGSHDRDLRGGPGQHQVVAHVARVHDDVGATIGFSQGHAYPGNGGPGVGEGHLRSVADHAAPLQVLSRVKAGGVDQGHQRKVEGVAECHEARSLLRGADVESSGHRLWLVGHQTHWSAADRGQRGDQVGSPLGAWFEEVAVVDDASHH